MKPKSVPELVAAGLAAGRPAGWGGGGLGGGGGRGTGRGWLGRAGRRVGRVGPAGSERGRHQDGEPGQGQASGSLLHGVHGAYLSSFAPAVGAFIGRLGVAGPGRIGIASYLWSP